MLRRFVKDLAIYLPSQLLPALTSFISAPILTRLFLPAEYGIYMLAAGLVDLLYQMTSSGFGSGVVRFFPAYKARSALGSFFATLGVSVGAVIAVVCGVGLFALFLLREYLPASLYSLLVISILVFGVQAPFVMLANVVRAQEKSKLYTIVSLLTSYSGLGFGLMLIFAFGFRADGLLWGTFLAFALSLPFLLFATTRGVSVRTTDFRVHDSLQMWRYALPLLIGNMAMWGLRLSDRYLIGFFRPASEVGLYSASYNISGKSMDILVTLFLLSMGPMVMNTWESHGRAATEKLLTMITRVFVIVCLPAAAGLTVLAFPFVALLTAKAYHAGYQIVGYVVFSGFAYGLSQIAGRGLLIGKNTRRYAVNQIVAALVNLGLNLLLIPLYGFLAAGITTLIGYLVLLGLQVWSSQSSLCWCFPWKTLRNATLATTLMSLSTFGVYSLSGTILELHLGYLLSSIALAIPVYFVSLWLLGEANEEERGAVGRFWKRARVQIGLLDARQ